MKYLSQGVVVGGLVLGTSFCFAGNYAIAYGETIKEATENATALAEKAVASRGKGCVGPGKDGQEAVQMYGKENGVWKVGVHYNHQDGSCGKRKSLTSYVSDLAVLAKAAGYGQ